MYMNTATTTNFILMIIIMKIHIKKDFHSFFFCFDRHFIATFYWKFSIQHANQWKNHIIISEILEEEKTPKNPIKRTQKERKNCEHFSLSSSVDVVKCYPWPLRSFNVNGICIRQCFMRDKLIMCVVHAYDTRYTFQTNRRKCHIAITVMIKIFHSSDLCRLCRWHFTR